MTTIIKLFNRARAHLCRKENALFLANLPKDPPALSSAKISARLEEMAERFVDEPRLRMWADETIQQLTREQVVRFGRAREKIYQDVQSTPHLPAWRTVGNASCAEIQRLADAEELHQLIENRMANPRGDWRRAEEYKDPLPAFEACCAILMPHQQIGLCFAQATQWTSGGSPFSLDLDHHGITLHCEYSGDRIHKKGIALLYQAKCSPFFQRIIGCHGHAGILLAAWHGSPDAGPRPLGIAAINGKRPAEMDLPASIATSLVGPIPLTPTAYDFSRTGYHVVATRVPSIHVLCAEILLRPIVTMKKHDTTWEPAHQLRRVAQQIWQHWRAKEPQPLQTPPEWEDILTALFDVIHDPDGVVTFVWPEDYTGPAQNGQTRDVQRNRPGHER